jgi:DNA polymerase-4
MAILQEVASAVEKVSVDEAYMDLSDQFAHLDDPDAALTEAVPIARQIKARIASERNLTASIGIGSNKFLAKLGSDLQKPDGLTLIPEHSKVAFLRPLALRTIPGVGPVTAKTLEERGLLTIGDLQDSGVELAEIVGSWALRLKALSIGEDDRELDLSDERKSISSETTFLEDTDDRGALRAALRELAADLADTLHKHEAGARTVHVKVRYSDFTTVTRQIRLEEPLSESRDIYRMACFLLARDKLVRRPLRLIGVGASTLIPQHTVRQLRLPL